MLLFFLSFFLVQKGGFIKVRAQDPWAERAACYSFLCILFPHLKSNNFMQIVQLSCGKVKENIFLSP